MSIVELKQWVKETAKDIRNHKIATKKDQRSGKYTAGTMQLGLLKKKIKARHHHVAYAEMLGRDRRGQIEIKRKLETPPLDETWIQKIKDEYTADEAVCIGS
jgi:hypothetical protein